VVFTIFEQADKYYLCLHWAMPLL